MHVNTTAESGHTGSRWRHDALLRYAPRVRHLRCRRGAGSASSVMAAISNSALKMTGHAQERYA